MAGSNNSALAGRIQGMREAKAAFQALPEAMRDRSNAATQLTVQEIARLAKGRVRSSPAIRTRALLDHIGWSMNEKNGRGRVGVSRGTTVITVGKKKIRVRGIIKAGKGGSALKSAGAKKTSPTQYAHLVEFGARGGKMPAEPFMIPSAEQEKSNYLSRMVAAGRKVETDLAAIGSRTL